jgi:hypothetical protein
VLEPRGRHAPIPRHRRCHPATRTNRQRPSGCRRRGRRRGGGHAAHATTGLGHAPTKASSAPPPPTTATPHDTTTPNPPASPTTTLPLGRIERLHAVQAVGTRTVWVVGKGAILTTRDGGRTWARVWRGAQELFGVDFVSASTGWALGDHILLGTVDGGQHWRRLGQPRFDRLRQVHFSSPTQGWGVAVANDQPVDPDLVDVPARVEAGSLYVSAYVATRFRHWNTQPGSGDSAPILRDPAAQP